MRAGRWGVGQGRAQAWRARGGAATGGRARAAERTMSMPYMNVTLDVSKPTGWLKLFAPCAESKGESAKPG